MVKLNPKVKYGTALHEILHTLGFPHEQGRFDREDYITVQWQNIKDKWKYAFARTQMREQYSPYDWASIMHYGAKAFSKNKWETLTSKIRGKSVRRPGQRVGLST